MIPVQHIGIQVDTVGPRDSAGDLIEMNLAEGVRVSEFFEDSAMQDRFEVELPD
jgi:hypothetical protein